MSFPYVPASRRKQGEIPAYRSGSVEASSTSPARKAVTDTSLVPTSHADWSSNVGFAMR